MANQAKSHETEELISTIEIRGNKNRIVEKNDNDDFKSTGNAKLRTSMFVKVTMDGMGIGRKVDLNAHGSYKALAKTLEEMFLQPPTALNETRPSTQENLKIAETRSSKLLDGSAGFVLTYEDKEGDWMLVGDVPWGMFLGSVKRLRIMRTSQVTRIGSHQPVSKYKLYMFWELQES